MANVNGVNSGQRNQRSNPSSSLAAGVLNARLNSSALTQEDRTLLRAYYNDQSQRKTFKVDIFNRGRDIYSAMLNSIDSPERFASLYKRFDHFYFAVDALKIDKKAYYNSMINVAFEYLDSSRPDFLKVLGSKNIPGRIKTLKNMIADTYISANTETETKKRLVFILDFVSMDVLEEASGVSRDEVYSYGISKSYPDLSIEGKTSISLVNSVIDTPEKDDDAAIAGIMSKLIAQKVQVLIPLLQNGDQEAFKKFERYKLDFYQTMNFYIAGNAANDYPIDTNFIKYPLTCFIPVKVDEDLEDIAQMYIAFRTGDADGYKKLHDKAFQRYEHYKRTSPDGYNVKLYKEIFALCEERLN